MYEFVRGPLLWCAFLVFAVGLVYRIVALVILSRRKDPVIYDHLNLRWALRSIFHWLLPLNHTFRQYPIYCSVAYLFHILLLTVPIFLLAHNILWEESWSLSLWSFPEVWTDYLTIALIAAVLFMTVRRAVVSHVRVVTTFSDYLFLIVTVLPFITGYMAYHQWFDYRTVLIVHILSGELMLVLIPFTKLAHMLLFFLARAQVGMEFGQRRGTVTW